MSDVWFHQIILIVGVSQILLDICKIFFLFLTPTPVIETINHRSRFQFPIFSMTKHIIFATTNDMHYVHRYTVF